MFGRVVLFSAPAGPQTAAPYLCHDWDAMVLCFNAPGTLRPLLPGLPAGVLQSYCGTVGSIAVISPYKAQVFTLREEFRRTLGGEAALAATNIEFGTVDGFQVGYSSSRYDDCSMLVWASPPDATHCHCWHACTSYSAGICLLLPERW